MMLMDVDDVPTLLQQEPHRREPGCDFAPCALVMTDAECTSELNSLKRHLRGIPKSDPGERAEALACIMHLRARQFVLASQSAALERSRDERQVERFRRQREAYAKAHPTK